MYKNKPYGLYKYGYIEDIEKMSSKELYEEYKQLLENCKIDIFVSGRSLEKVTQIIKDNEIIQELKPRTPEKIEVDVKKEKIAKNAVKV